MSNSLIMMTTPTSSSILASGIVPLTTISRRRGQVITSTTDNIVLNRPGYYKVNASITFTGDEAGDAVITLQKNGVDVVGLNASTTITTADTEVRTLNISGVVRVGCCEGISNLSLLNTGIAITSSNVEIDVEYLG
jgi:hypothetical protein